MKFKAILPLFCLFILWHGLTSSKRNPSDPPVSRTGAPGETTCGASGCHSGGTFVGTVAISGIPDTVQPNQVYPITLTQTSNATRGGFELVCLDGANNNCGTLATAAGVSIGNAANGRRYARQSSPHTLSAGSTSWTFNWTAPATLTNNNITFYYITLAANGNGEKSGDNPLLGTRTTVLATPSVGIATATENNIKVYPTVAEDFVHITLPQPENGHVTLYNLQGKQLVSQNFDHETVLDVAPLAAGIYVVQIEVDGKRFTQKITVR